MELMHGIIADETAEFTPLNSWIKRREIDGGTIDFKNGIENDLEQLSKLLGTELVIMTVRPK